MHKASRQLVPRAVRRSDIRKLGRRLSEGEHHHVDLTFLASYLLCWVPKYDLCGQGNLQPFVTFQVMRDALNATGRHFVYSFEPQTLRGQPVEWPPYVGNLFRTAADMGPYFGAANRDALLSNAWLSVATKGGWTDPGYLEVGNAPQLFNVSESRSMFAIWCILKCPLLIAADLATISAEHLKVLLSKELIAINQDPLAHIGRLVSTSIVCV